MKWELGENGALKPTVVLERESRRVVLCQKRIQGGLAKEPWINFPSATAENSRRDALGQISWHRMDNHEDEILALTVALFEQAKQVVEAEIQLKTILANSHPDDLEGKSLTELIEMVNLELIAEHERGGPL